MAKLEIPTDMTARRKEIISVRAILPKQTIASITKRLMYLSTPKLLWIIIGGTVVPPLDIFNVYKIAKPIPKITLPTTIETTLLLGIKL